MTGLSTPTGESLTASNAEPLVPISVAVVGEAILDAIEDTSLVNSGLVPLIDASTDPEAIASSGAVMTILDATTADDGLAGPPVVVGLINEVTSDTLAIGLADPLTGELFALGISSDLVVNGTTSGSPLPGSASEPVYLIAGAPQPGLAVFVFSGLGSDAASEAPAILEPGLEVVPGVAPSSLSIGASNSPATTPMAPVSEGVLANTIPSPSAQLTVDPALFIL